MSSDFLTTLNLIAFILNDFLLASSVSRHTSVGAKYNVEKPLKIHELKK